jgi:hypothetical protein
MAMDEDTPMPLQESDVRHVALIDEVPEDWVVSLELCEPSPALSKEAHAMFVQPGGT